MTYFYLDFGDVQRLNKLDDLDHMESPLLDTKTRWK